MFRSEDIRALEDNLCDFWTVFGRAPGGTLVNEPNHMWFETPIAAIPYNAVLHARQMDDLDSVVDRHFQHFAAAQKPFFWLLHPSAAPGLEALLASRGFAEFECCPGMAVNLGDVPEPEEVGADVEFHEVKQEDEILQMLDFAMWRWNVAPDWWGYLNEVRHLMRLGQVGSPRRGFMAWIDGEPVAKAITHETAGVIGLYGVATKPEARGRGLGRNICLHALKTTDAGRNMRGVLHSTPMAVGLYEAMGFEQVADFRLFGAPDTDQF